jgi:hypothetical protein
MPQVMLYLDEETEALMRQRARECGLPYSRWVASLIRAEALRAWPDDFLRLAGSVPDAPLATDLRAADVSDLPREKW